MCEHGNTVLMTVCVPARLSHSGAMRLKNAPVDSCIANLVRELNERGMLTANSCCGHGAGPGSIVFHGGSEMTIRDARRALVNAKFDAQLEKYSKLSQAEKTKTLQEIGILGPNERLTERFGGTDGA